MNESIEGKIVAIYDDRVAIQHDKDDLPNSGFLGFIGEYLYRLIPFYKGPESLIFLNRPETAVGDKVTVEVKSD